MNPSQSQQAHIFLVVVLLLTAGAFIKVFWIPRNRVFRDRRNPGRIDRRKGIWTRDLNDRRKHDRNE